MNTTQTPAEYHEAACKYVEKYYGTRAGNYIEEGNADRARLKGELLNEYVNFIQELREMLKSAYPAMNDHVKFSFTFTE